MINRTLLVLTVVLTTLQLANILWWVMIAVGHESFMQVRSAYLAPFPRPIADTFVITLSCLGLSVIGIGLLAYLLRKSYRSRLSTLLLIVNSLMGMWLLFTLM